jgi:mannose-6-phosphate isomerase-like protein (cupin superfamily)
MLIVSLPASTGSVDIQSLLNLGPHDQAAIDVGIASFPASVRSPESGFSVHEQHEVSFVLEGEFILETPDESQTVKAGQLVHFGPGEQHASTAVCESRVYYVLFGRPTDAA